MLQMIYLRQIVDHDIRIVRVLDGIILVILLGGIKSVERHDLRHDRAAKNFRLINLIDVRVRDFLLVLIRVKNYGTILSSLVRALTIQLRGIVRDGEKYFQKLAHGNLRWIVNNLHGFGVPGPAFADGFIIRRAGGPA